MRVVADTNIYISALNFGGFSDEVIGLALAGAIELCISEPILEEIQGVLLRKFLWSEDRARRAAFNIRRIAALVTPQETLQVIREDEPDNRILECALEHFARCCRSSGEAPKGRKILAHGASRGKAKGSQDKPRRGERHSVYRNKRNALEAHADAIVTGDFHLLKLKKFRGAVVLSPREFLTRYQQAGGAGE